MIGSLFVPLGAGGIAGPIGDLEDQPDTDDESSDAVIGESLQAVSGDVEVVVQLEGVGQAALSDSDDPVGTLKAQADRSHDDIETFAEDHDGVTVEKQFWITNAALLTVETDRVDLERLAAVEGVTEIHENFELEADRVAPENVSGNENGTNVTQSTETATADGESYTYGLEQINVPEVWNEFDTQGDGATVAVLDSGVDVDNHSELEPIDGGWNDFVNGDPEPYDDEGHGTHVSGTVVGEQTDLGDQYGVAPEAELLHGKVLDETDTAYYTDVVAAMEWAADHETDVDVLSMSLSWSETHHSGFIDPVVNAKTAGLVVVGSAGNTEAGTSGSPANVYDAFSVGASDSSEDIADFSSGEEIHTDDDWGSDAPSWWPESYVVPDISAPGESVQSSIKGGGYGWYSGTSMAAPHVTGAVALMESATDDELSPSEIEDTLRETAWKPDGEPDDPDIRYGHGIIDAEAATVAVLTDGEVTGTVADNTTDEPIADAEITLEQIDGDHVYETTTDEDGTYSLDNVFGSNEYEFTIDADGYESSTSEITVPDTEKKVDETLVGDAELEVDVVGDRFGDPLEDIELRAEGEAGSYSGSGDDGTYSVPNVASGDREYTVVAEREGYQLNETTITVDSAGVHQLDPIPLEGDATLEIAVEDEVTETPAANADLVLERNGATYEPTETTDSSGLLEVAVPGTGEAVEAKASATGYDSASNVSEMIESGDSESLTIAVTGNASIGGNVTDQLTGSPVENATVTAEDGDRLYDARTDEDGTYRIEDVPGTGDEYDLTAEHEEYHTSESNETIESDRNETVDLSLPPVGNATIEGTVTDGQTDVGIPEATVSIEQEENELQYETSTDAEGQYTVDDIVGGMEYTVTVDADGYESTTKERAVSEDDTEIVELDPTGTAELVGTVVDGPATGEPGIEHATVTVDYRNGGEFTVPDATDETGAFTVGDVPANATYDIIASADQYDSSTKSNVTVESDEHDVDPIGLEGDSSISGEVVDPVAEDSITDANVTVTSGDETYETTSGADGQYGVDVPGNATVEVDATADGYEYDPFELEIESGKDITEKLDLEGTATLEGTVTDAVTEEPIHNATIHTDRDAINYTLLTDESGEYSASVGGDAEYTVTGGADGYEATNKTVAVSDDTGESSFDLEGNAAVSGTVTDTETDEPVGNATLVLENGAGSYDATSEDNGSYAVEHVPGSDEAYNVSVNATGYDSTTADLTVEDEADAVADYAVAGNASITGTVTAASDSNVSLEETTVVATAGTGSYDAEADENGIYTVENVPGTGASYDVNATARAYDTNLTSLEVHAEEERDFVIEQREQYLGIEDVDAPTEVEEGGTFDVTAAVRNLGTESVDNESVTLLRDGEPVDNGSVTLNASEETTATVTDSIEETGEYDQRIETDNESSSYEIEVTEEEEEPGLALPEPDDPELSIVETDLSSSELETGETVVLSVVVQNSGTAEASDALGVEIDGEQVVSETVSPEAGTTETLEFEYSFDAVGSYDITVDGEPVETIEVADSDTEDENGEAAESETESESASDETEDGGDDDVAYEMPGFGIPAAVVAVVLVVVARVIGE